MDPIDTPYEESNVSLSKEEEKEKDNIVKLSGFNFSKSPGKSSSTGLSFQPSAMDDDEEFFINDDNDESDDDSDEFEPTKRAGDGQMYSGTQYSDDDEEEDDREDEEQVVEGAYDPREFEHLNVDPEIQGLFSYIEKYKCQSIILDYKLKPFVPDYIPAVGDIDAFLKVESPVILDSVNKTRLGLTVLDEPEAVQSDPNVLDLQLRAVTKVHSAGKEPRSKKVMQGGDTNVGKEIEQWIKDISDLHRSKPAPSVNYRQVTQISTNR